MSPGDELVVRQERAEDHEAVREVHTQAFGDSERVPVLVDALRAARPTLALVDVLSLSPLGALPARRFQVARLSSYEKWMTGTFVYSDVFWALDCVGLRGERSGPGLSETPG